ncbi:hypothetical protein T11_11357 [Trichinella zimbabwensis]|uniref:Uncharacterized protein n=1 Tax=Trichinella zimbabwensis TaxID=268475 RepID=A0A0V1H0L0_9BILA|nr:hypothetical protein T11_11357 [Trichinella zimbabwensis]
MMLCMRKRAKRLKREIESTGALCCDLFFVIWYLKAKFATAVSSLDDYCIQYIPTIASAIVQTFIYFFCITCG